MSIIHIMAPCRRAVPFQCSIEVSSSWRSLSLIWKIDDIFWVQELILFSADCSSSRNHQFSANAEYVFEHFISLTVLLTTLFLSIFRPYSEMSIVYWYNAYVFVPKNVFFFVPLPISSFSPAMTQFIIIVFKCLLLQLTSSFAKYFHVI